MVELPKINASHPMPPCKPPRSAQSDFRDQIAIEVMKLVSCPILEGADPCEDNPVERIARISYALADAMLAERAK